MVAANARTAITFALSPGQASDAKQGRLLLGGIGPLPAPLHLIMDRAYEDNETRQLALDFGFIPVVPPKCNRLEPWQYDKAMYRKRNEIERLFRRLKGFRRIFSRFEKLDVLFLGFRSPLESPRPVLILTVSKAYIDLRVHLSVPLQHLFLRERVP
jgi:transposase